MQKFLKITKLWIISLLLHWFALYSLKLEDILAVYIVAMKTVISKVLNLISNGDAQRGDLSNDQHGNRSCTAVVGVRSFHDFWSTTEPWFSTYSHEDSTSEQYVLNSVLEVNICRLPGRIKHLHYRNSNV